MGDTTGSGDAALEGNIMAIQYVKGFVLADRYLFDHELSSAKGWAQVDTKQDAAYYGTWTNPTTLEVFSYCEGDTYLTKCDTEDDYRQALTVVIDWNKQNGNWLGIDPGLKCEIKQRFASLGFSEFLH